MKKAWIGIVGLIAVAVIGLVVWKTVLAEDTEEQRASEISAWLADNVKDGLIEVPFEGSPMPDYGLTADVLLAVDDLNDDSPAIAAIAKALTNQADVYVTGSDPKALYAGSAAKLAVALDQADVNPRSVGQRDLIADIEGRIQDGDELGRATDAFDPESEFGADYSNTIGQSWVVRALVDAKSDKAQAAVDYLLRQQCSDGGFRTTMFTEGSAGATCDDDEGRDITADATALSVVALLEAKDDGIAGLDAPIAKGLDALEAMQDVDGSFEADDIPNANSTGLAAQALHEGDRHDAASKAGDWIEKVLVTGDAAEPLKKDTGAIAFTPEAFDAAKTDGIGEDAIAEWIRATSQAGPGLLAAMDGN